MSVVGDGDLGSKLFVDSDTVIREIEMGNGWGMAGTGVVVVVGGQGC